jgi:peptidoglycan/LPS O-acetylase OafA/YrhL
VSLLSSDSPLRRAIGTGYVSVSFFFFLSGYILATVYLSRGKQINLRNFFVARFARIYPIFTIALLLDVPRLMMNRAKEYGFQAAALKTIASFVGHIFMLQAWTAKLKYDLDPPAWSLSVEAFLYLTFAFLGDRLWKVRGRSLLWCAAVIYLAGQLAVWIVLQHSHDLSVNWNPLLHLSTFLLGILTCRWHVDRPTPSSLQANTALFGLVLVFGFIVSTKSGIPFGFIHDGLLAPIFAAVIVVLSNPDTTVARWLSQKRLLLLGEASFTFYLLHLVIWRAIYKDGQQASLPAFFVFLLITIAISIGCFLLMETPARTWITRRLKARITDTMEASTDATA